MNDKWRKVSNVIFTLSFIGGGLVLFALTIFNFTNNGAGAGFGTLFGGAAIALIVYPLYGAILEFFDNVAAIKNKLCEEKATGTINSKVSEGAEIIKNYGLSTPLKKSKQCECGLKLSEDTKTCPSCGKAQ